MADPARAIFLSYASEDAEAARRITDALRAFNLEVWFDRDELRGGDAWDAHIRQQIHECALFLPIISAQTEHRREGYFRREWRIAVERTHDMAEGVPFIVPIVIDDTNGSRALVPDAFRAVHWTLLPRGVPGTEFVEHVRTVLDGRDLARLQQPAAAGAADSGIPSAGKKRSVQGWLIAAIGVFAVLGAALIWSGRQHADSGVAAKSTTLVTAPAKPVREKSLAVLPLDNLSKKEEDLFFTDGIHDDLLTQISHIREIKTISRTSVMAYRGSEKNLRQIAAELGVATILEGGVQRAGNQVRINVQLIDAATDTHLWAETYTRELTAENIFGIQSEIAGAIATALKAVLSPAEQKQLEKVPTANLAALEAYFRGKAADARHTRDGLNEAIDHFQKAVALDPGFALGYVGLARAHLGQVWFGGLSLEEQSAKAASAVAKALELDPQSGAAYAALGDLKFYQGQDPAAEVAFKRALEITPNDAYAHMGYGKLLQWHLNRPAEALLHMNMAAELDPETFGDHLLEVEILQMLGRRDEARTILEAAVSKRPDNADIYRLLGVLYAGSYQRYDEAIRWLRRGHALEPTNPNFPNELAHAYWNLGDRNETAQWCERALAIAPQSQNAVSQRGWILLCHGETEKALAILRQAPSGPNFAFAITAVFNADLAAGRPEHVRAYIVAAIPDLVGPADPVIDSGNFWPAAYLGFALQAMGETEHAGKLFTAVLAVLPTVPRLSAGGTGFGVLDASIYAVKGNRRGALDALQEAIDAGWRSDGLREMSEFASLRDDPEFKAIVAKVRADLDAQLANVRQMEAKGELAPIPKLPAAP